MAKINETWGEWGDRVGVDIHELCVCGHERIKHRGKKLLGGCTHERRIARMDPVKCMCTHFRVKKNGC